VIDAAVATDTGADGEPGEITAIRRASGMPFPPPSGKFPAPAGLTKSLADAERTAKSARRVAGSLGSKKRLIMIVGSAMAGVLLLGGGYFAYMKFTAPPPPPPPRPKVVAKPKSPPPVVEVPKIEPAAVASVPSAAIPAPVVAAPPPPVASVAFKNWIENLKISGVRAGHSPKVFIGGTAYGPGDLVNPQLGITFVGYTAETRMLIFKDAAGAQVERRN
jgi:hypothetical protein